MDEGEEVLLGNIVTQLQNNQEDQNIATKVTWVLLGGILFIGAAALYHFW